MFIFEKGMFTIFLENSHNIKKDLDAKINEIIIYQSGFLLAFL